MAFDLRQLRYFLAVAAEGSISAAATSIPVAQQSLSEQIRSLERQIGAALFTRGPRGVQLTPVGEELQVHARSLINQADRAFDRVQRVAGGERQTIRVGYLPSVGNYIVPPLVRSFAHTHPELVLTTEDFAIAALIEGLREGRLDAGLTRPPLVDDIATEHVLTEPVAAVLPAGHRLAAAETLDLADLAGEPWVLTPRSSWERVQSLLALVAAGVGVTRLPMSARTLRDTGVTFVPLRGEYADVVVAWIDDRPRPGVRLLIDVIRRTAKESNLLSAG
jgi:DNA-binding transcriptional LysR family regulator